MPSYRTALTSHEREEAAVFHSWSDYGSIDPMMACGAEGVVVTAADRHYTGA